MINNDTTQCHFFSLSRNRWKSLTTKENNSLIRKSQNNNDPKNTQSVRHQKLVSSYTIHTSSDQLTLSTTTTTTILPLLQLLHLQIPSIFLFHLTQLLPNSFHTNIHDIITHPPSPEHNTFSLHNTLRLRPPTFPELFFFAEDGTFGFGQGVQVFVFAAPSAADTVGCV